MKRITFMWIVLTGALLVPAAGFAQDSNKPDAATASPAQEAAISQIRCGFIGRLIGQSDWRFCTASAPSEPRSRWS